MDWLSDALSALDGVLGSAAYFPYALLGVGVWFTIYLRFPQIRFFAHAWRVLTGRYDSPDAPGDTTRPQALATALSGTVGTGNIGGVALAIYLGGPAALFWMWITAFLGMTTKMVEVTISFKYRVKDDNGQMAGGPMYYMERGLGWKPLAIFFALATVVSSFGSGNMPQSNNIAAGLESTMSVPTWLTGAVLAVLLALVIIGGIRRIAKVTSALVPVMGVFYALAALAVIFSNIDNVGPAVQAVFSQAFNGSAALGGFLGASFAYAFVRGVNRGLYSNEAGQGSAPIAHASAKGTDPTAEGMVAILEPFLDTIIICTLTGLAILASGVWSEKFPTNFQATDTEIVAGVYSDTQAEHVRALAAHLDLVPPDNDPVKAYTGSLMITDGQLPSVPITVLHNRSIAEDVLVLRDDGQPFSGTMEVNDGSLATDDLTLTGRSLLHSVSLTAEAFKRSWLGDFGQYAVSIGLLLFAFSTAIAWSYYGDRAITYLFGSQWVMPYRMLYAVGFFVAAIADTTLIWQISAITVALMTLPNLLGIVMMSREIKSTVNTYWEDFRSQNRKN